MNTTAPQSNRDTLLASWKEANAQLKHFRTLEGELRKQVIDAFSEQTSEMASGVENVDIGWGHTLKVTHKLEYKLDDTKLDKALEQIEKTVEYGELLAERLVKFKPELSVSEYKKLPGDAKKIIDTVLTIKPAAKSVEIVAKPAK